ncbi:MAG: hypothetical protein FWH27_07205 [Planctomycetaceae bacterium]|nr:hypothetical protein [Planctomycetaceae bacterium]
MRQRPFRFLHASDIHLDRPVTGLGDLPAHLLQRVIDAPRLAAERLFDVAIREQVDFVVLCGNVLNPYQTGPWGPVFLVSQFEKLAAANIHVSWAAGKLDAAERWPAELPLPPNVTLFPTSHVDESVFGKDGFSIARILGESRSPERRKIRPGEFNPDTTGLFTLAATVGKVNPARLKKRGIDYWALGGMPSRHTSYGESSDPLENDLASEPPKTQGAQNSKGQTPANKVKSNALKRVRDDFTRSSIVHYPGQTLARSFEDTGNYGATLVEVDESGKTRLTLMPTTPLRFVREQVRFEPGMSFDRLKDELRDRLIAYRSMQENCDLYIDWAIDSSEEFELKLRRDGTAEKIRDKLRQEFGMQEPFAWVVEIKPAIPEHFPPEFYDQETIMGDYLRKLRRYHHGETKLPSLERYLPQDGPIFPPGDQTETPGPVTDLDAYAEPLLRDTNIQRDDMLREAGLLGVDLLGNRDDV